MTEVASKVSRTAVVREARRFMGTPFVHQASLRGIGCDCIGLVVGVASELGLPEAAAWKRDLRFMGYGRLPVPTKLLEACNVYLDRIEVNRAGLGDVLLMTFMREPMHFGIISDTEPFYMIHSYATAGHVVEHILDEKWRQRVLYAFRLRGVA